MAAFPSSLGAQEAQPACGLSAALSEPRRQLLQVPWAALLVGFAGGFGSLLPSHLLGLFSTSDVCLFPEMLNTLGTPPFL